jgi:hypothetical protein
MIKLRKVYERRIAEQGKVDAHKRRRQWRRLHIKLGYTPEVIDVDPKTGRKTWIYRKTYGPVSFAGWQGEGQ